MFSGSVSHSARAIIAHIPQQGLYLAGPPIFYREGGIGILGISKISIYKIFIPAR